MNVTLENIGPISELEIPIPEGGGVVVLRGRNGVGKTTALEATQKVLGTQTYLSCRDGADKGNVSGFGVNVTVGRSMRRTGELEATHLEGRFSVADLVDPGIKDPEAADKKRIRAIVNLTGAEASEEKFREVIGDELFEELCGPTGDEVTLLDMHTAYRLELHECARRCEREQAKNEGQASALRESAGDISTEPVDEAALKDRVVSAERELTIIQENRKAGDRLSDRAQEAKLILDTLEVPTDDEVCRAREMLEKINEQVIDLKAKLGEAEERQATAKDILSTLEVNHSRAAEHKAVIAESMNFAYPTDQELEAAKSEAAEADKAWKQAIVDREARHQLGQAKTADKQARRASKRAEAARIAAKQCDKVLADAIKTDRLIVKGGRLYVPTSRGEILYSELSNGEQWEIALDLASQLVGETGLIVVPQVAWEGLDIKNRELVAEHAKEKRVTIITAEAQRVGESPELHVDVISGRNR
jgi:hypothetical protein